MRESRCVLVDHPVLPLHVLYHVARGCPDIREEAIALLRGPELDLPLLHDVVNLEDESLVHLRVNHETGGVERVGKHLVEVEVPGPRLGLVSHKKEYRV